MNHFFFAPPTGDTTIDLVCSLILIGLIGAAVVAYVAHAIVHGREHYRRVERDGGSALLGEGAMSAGYWALQPIGTALAAAGVTPNAITLGSLALGGVAAVALALGHFGVAAALVAVATLGDVLDGMVARVTGHTSRAGEVLDSTADRYQEFVFLAALAYRYRADGTWMVLCLAALLGSMMVSYVSAKAAEMRVTIPRGSMRRAERAAYLTAGAVLTPVVAAFAAGQAPWVSHAPMLAALLAVAVVANISAVRRLRALMDAVGSQPVSPALPPHAQVAMKPSTNATVNGGISVIG